MASTANAVGSEDEGAVALLYAGVVQSRPDLSAAEQVRTLLRVIQAIKEGPGVCRVCGGKGYFRAQGGLFVCPL